VNDNLVIKEYHEALINMYEYFKDAVEYYISTQELDWAAAAISRMPESSAKVWVWDIYDRAGGDSELISNFLEPTDVSEEKLLINNFKRAKSNYLRLPINVIKRNKFNSLKGE